MPLGFLAYILIQAVLFVASDLLTPKPHFDDATPEDPQGPRSEEGDVIPVVFGTVKQPANITYFGNPSAYEENERVKTGLFSSKQVTVGFQYEAIFQAIICHGPVDELLDIVWDGNKSIAQVDTGPVEFGPIDRDGDGIDESYGVIAGGVIGAKTTPAVAMLRPAGAAADDGTSFLMSEAQDLLGGYRNGGGLIGRFRMYWGTVAQNTDLVLQQMMGVTGFAAKYEGQAHAVFGYVNPANHAQIGRFSYGERSMLPSIEFVVRRCPSNLGLSAAQTNLNGGANPAEIIYDALTNAVWGSSVPTTYIDLPSFQTAGATLATEGFAMNMSLTSESNGDNIISEVLRYIDGQVQQNPITGKIELTLNRNDYVVANLPLINESNASDVELTRPSWASVQNEVKVIYTARKGVFFVQVPTQPIQDIGAQRNFADVNSVTLQYPAVTDPVLAVRLATRALRRVSTPLAKIRMQVDRTAGDFRVGRPFKFSWADYGVSLSIYRVASVDYGNMYENKIAVTAVEDVFSLELPMYAIPVDPPVVDVVLGKRYLTNAYPDMSETASTGYLELTVTPNPIITAVEFNTQSGNRIPSGWIGSDRVDSFHATVDKHVTLQSSIQWRVMGTLQDGTIGELASGAVSFDVEGRPTQPTIDILPGSSAGKVTILIYVDPDTYSIKYIVSKIGQPSEAAVRATAPVILAPGQTVVTLADVLTLAAGEQAYITVLAYDSVGNESEVSILGPDDTFVYPEMRQSPTENGRIGTLTLTPVDPQGRLTRVSMAAVLGNSVPVFVDVARVGGVYTMNVDLVEKQPSRIDYKAYAMVGGTEIAVDQKSVRFAIGSIPIPPEVSYQIDPDGTLTVTSKGDSDTTLTHIVVALDTAPTSDTLDAAVGADNSFAGRNAIFVYKVAGLVRKLTIGQKFYIGVRAYNGNLSGTINEQGSQVVVQTDQWIGPSDARATVLVSAVGIDSRSITFSGITFGAQTSRVAVKVREYKTDPGAANSVMQIGHDAPGSPLLTTGGSIIVPIANPGNWVIVTLEATDALNRVGTGILTGTGLAAGTINIKVQSASAAQPAPNAPVDLALSAPASDTIQLNITMPGSNLPATLRIYRDGVALPDIARSALAGAVQTYFDSGRTPGATHTYQVYGVNAAGVLSATGSPIRSLTLAASTLPTPTIAVGEYNTSQGGAPVTITPGAGSPGGVTYQLEHSRQVIIEGTPSGYDAYASAESGTATSFVHAHGQGSFPINDKLRVYATKVGYLNSDYSNEVIVAIAKWNPTFGGG